MIQDIYNIGEFILKREKIDVNNPIEILIQDPNTSGRIKNVLAVIIEKKGDSFNYLKIEREEYDTEKLLKYLYRKGSPRGTDVLPTSIIIDINKTFQIKILNWFKQFEKKERKAKLEDEDKTFVTSIYTCIKDNFDKILGDLKEKLKLIKKNEGSIITLKFLENKEPRYLGDYSFFQRHLITQSKIDYYYSKKYKVSSKKEKQVCSICLRNKPEVFGFVQTYNFYTVDKTGFLAGGFTRENAWKNYPVCLECALVLEVGKKYINKNLTFNFYGIFYKVIPKFILKKDLGEIFEVLEEYKKSPKLKKDDITKLTADEDEIFEKLSEQANYINFNLLFYQEQQSAFRILQFVEDILPSRLKQIITVKKYLEQLEFFKECQYSQKPILFNFGILRRIFPKSRKMDFYRRNFDKYFLDLTNKIFSNKLIDYQFIIKSIMKEVRVSFVHDNFPLFALLCLQSFMLLLFLDKLNLFKNLKGGNIMKKDKMTTLIKFDETDELTNKILKFFQEFSENFQYPAQKVVFLVGILTKFLLNIQYLERNATPFMSKLQGLKLDEKLIKKLFPEIQNKLIEYGKNYYVKLESIISKFFLLAGNNWKQTNDEISFYFTLGMDLWYLFKINKEEGGNNSE